MQAATLAAQEFVGAAYGDRYAGQPSATMTREDDGGELMTNPNQYALLRERRFAPFFWTQFLGASNDYGFKNAFVVFVTFEAVTQYDAGTLVNLIGAVFILPFVLFSATSGQLAHKFE